MISLKFSSFLKFITSFKTAIVLVIGLTVFLFLKIHFSTISYKGPCGPQSNYKVFKAAHFHLLDNKNLYVYYPLEHCYTYKYSPAFAMFFGLFAWLPDWLGILLWTSISAILFILAIKALPCITDAGKAGIVYLIFFEFWVSMQSLQTNIMVASMLIIAFNRLEKKHYLLATGLIVATGFIKIFGLGALVLFLFYPKKFRLMVYTFGWILLLIFIPWVLMPFDQLVEIYNQWLNQIFNDYDSFIGMSIYSLLATTVNLHINKWIILITSLIIMFVSFFQVGKWKSENFRLLVLACLLVWFVGFNHKSESATYVIGMIGIAIWYFSSKRLWYDHVLIIFALIVLSIIFSDLVPKFIKNEIGFKYHLKALPVLLIWVRIIIELWSKKFRIKPQEEKLLVN